MWSQICWRTIDMYRKSVTARGRHCGAASWASAWVTCISCESGLCLVSASNPSSVAVHPGRQQMRTQGLGSLLPTQGMAQVHERPGLSSWLLVSAQPSPGCFGDCRSKPVDGRTFSCCLLPISASQVNKYKIIQNSPHGPGMCKLKWLIQECSVLGGCLSWVLNREWAAGWWTNEEDLKSWTLYAYRTQEKEGHEADFQKFCDGEQ